MSTETTFVFSVWPVMHRNFCKLFVFWFIVFYFFCAVQSCFQLAVTVIQRLNPFMFLIFLRSQTETYSAVHCETSLMQQHF